MSLSISDVGSYHYISLSTVVALSMGGGHFLSCQADTGVVVASWTRQASEQS